MLRVGPWFRLPLTIRWLVPELSKDFPTDRLPPIHMPLVYGKVIIKKKKIKKFLHNYDNDDDIFFSVIDNNSITVCSICNNLIDDNDNSNEDSDKVRCLKPVCKFVSHLICLAKKFNDNHLMILPIEGNCPECGINVLWGDLIRKMKGCYKDLTEATGITESDSELSDFRD